MNTEFDYLISTFNETITTYSTTASWDWWHWLLLVLGSVIVVVLLIWVAFYSYTRYKKNQLRKHNLSNNYASKINELSVREKQEKALVYARRLDYKWDKKYNANEMLAYEAQNILFRHELDNIRDGFVDVNRVNSAAKYYGQPKPLHMTRDQLPRDGLTSSQSSVNYDGFTRQIEDFNVQKQNWTQQEIWMNKAQVDHLKAQKKMEQRKNMKFQEVDRQNKAKQRELEKLAQLKNK